MAMTEIEPLTGQATILTFVLHRLVGESTCPSVSFLLARMYLPEAKQPSFQLLQSYGVFLTGGATAPRKIY